MTFIPIGCRKTCAPALRCLVAALAAASLCASFVARAGGIATDGSLGPRVTLPGPAYAIGADLGRQVGGNLFQSFHTFSLTQGESAVFSGPASVVNIIGRVTGPDASLIDGRIGSDIAGANLYLFNPQGIAFGSHASLDLSGSFRASTADYVRFADGSRFSASLGGDSVLSVAAPSAFGFVAAAPAAITLTGSSLRVADGRTLALVGGSVVLKGEGGTGRLTAPGGHVELMAAGPGETPIGEGAVTAPSYAGEVRLEDGMRVDASDAGGQVLVRAGNVSIDNSVVTAQATGAASAGGIDIAAPGSVSLAASTVQSASATSGGAGRIAIRAGRLVLVDSARIDTTTFGPGRGGTIDIDVGDLAMSRQSRISNSVQEGAAGTGGQTSIRASGNVRLDGYGTIIQSNTFGTGPGGSVSIDAATVDVLGGSVQAASTGSAPGGSVAIRTGALKVDLLGWVDASAYGTGPGGAIAIDAGSVDIVGESALLATGENGAGGRIAVRAASMRVEEGSYVDARTWGTAPAGSIAIDTGSLDVGSGSIVTATGDAGAGGSISVETGTLRLTGGGSILAGTYGDARAGAIAIDARDEISRDGRLGQRRSERGVGRHRRQGRRRKHRDHDAAPAGGDRRADRRRSRGQRPGGDDRDHGAIAVDHRRRRHLDRGVLQLAGRREHHRERRRPDRHRRAQRAAEPEPGLRPGIDRDLHLHRGRFHPRGIARRQRQRGGDRAHLERQPGRAPSRSTSAGSSSPTAGRSTPRAWGRATTTGPPGASWSTRPRRSRSTATREGAPAESAPARAAAERAGASR